MDFDRDTWRTPQYIFNWLNDKFNFDVDLAASDDHHYCDTYFTKEDSALTAEWWDHGRVGFCNPPYSNIDPWVDRAILNADSFTTVMLIPAFNGEKRWGKIFEEASEITNIVGRIAFIHPVTGAPVGGNTKGSCVVVFGKNPNAYCDHEYVDRDEIIEWYS